MKVNNIPRELEERIKQVELDNSCPDCNSREVTEEELEYDVDMINPDVNTLDRG